MRCSEPTAPANLEGLYDADQQVGWSTYVNIDPYTSYEAADVATCQGPGE